MTRFQIYPETELACKYTKPLHKTQYSEILFEYEEGFDTNTGKLIKHPMATSHSATDENSYVPVQFLEIIGGKLKPQDKDLQELSLMRNTHFGAIHYDINLDMKLDYTIKIIFQEMFLTELEILHQLCELERTKRWLTDVKLLSLSYNSQITATLGLSPYEMVFNQKLRKPIIFTASSSKNAQGYCQPTKESICYNLPLHTNDEDHFQHP